jgi:hypothetical protein
MNTRDLLVASLALLFAPLAPAANAQITVTCTMCVTVTTNGNASVTCAPVACPTGGSKKLPYRMLLSVPEHSPCALKTPSGTTVHGRTSGGSCNLNRSLRSAELETHR